MAAQTKSNIRRTFSVGQVLLCTLAGLGVMMLFICLFAALLVRRSLPQTLLAPFSTIAACLGCFSAAWLLARLRGENGLLCGAIIFAADFLLLCGWSWINGSQSIEGFALVRTLLMLASSGAGGYLGMLWAEGHPHRR